MPIDPNYKLLLRRISDQAFAVYRFQAGQLVAVEALNRPKDYVRAHALIGQRDVMLPVT